MENEKVTYFLDEKAKIEVTKEDIAMARTKEITLTTYLNEKHQDKLQYTNGLDAFDAALVSAGIIVKGNEVYGIQASRMEVFFTTDQNKTLFPEFVVRTLKQTINASPILSYLIGETMTITGDTMKQPVLDLGENTATGKKNRDALKKVRISETADIPVGEIKLGETAISIYKYGRGIKASYEVMRRTTIDMFRKQVELIGTYAAYDEVRMIIDVIVNGDGNNNPAQVYKRSVLDANGTQGKISMTGLMKLMIKQFPISVDTLIVNEEGLIQLATLLSDKNLMNGVQPYIPFTLPQGFFSGLTIIYSPDVPKSNSNEAIIGINKSLSIRKIIEQGSMIQEAEKYAVNQTQALYLTENAGFAKIYNDAMFVYELD